MSTQTTGMSEQLQEYIRSVSAPRDQLWEQLRDETLEVAGFNIQISPEQGQLISMLIKIMDVKKAIEIGTFTGYSALCIARALPDDGQLITCDINAEWAHIAKRYWHQAGVSEKIELRLGQALETLDDLLDNGLDGAFDLAFIDADKINYTAYYEKCLNLLRPEGVVAIDNTLWGGLVADPDNQDSDTVAIRAFNELIHNDERVDSCLLTIGDGLTLAYKGAGDKR